MGLSDGIEIVRDVWRIVRNTVKNTAVCVWKSFVGPLRELARGYGSLSFLLFGCRRDGSWRWSWRRCDVCNKIYNYWSRPGSAASSAGLVCSESCLAKAWELRECKPSSTA